MTRQIHRFDVGLRGLVKTGEEVARLTGPQREERVSDLYALSYDLVNRAVGLAQWHASEGKTLRRPRELAAVVALFSGGNDSTTLAHLTRPWITHLGHANTTVGLEKTRQFVRDAAAGWGVPLLERASPKHEQDSYRALVLERGFPGPGQHYKMFQRLKEHALYAMARELAPDGHRQRVLLLAGRRREESQRRADVPELERRDFIMWCSPLVAWTKLDLNTYRLMNRESDPVPVNEVSEILHMSGECCCGSFAHEGELEEIAMWFGDDPGIAVIAELEELLKDREDIPPARRKWGWGAYAKDSAKLMERARMGMLCGCQHRIAAAV